MCPTAPEPRASPPPACPLCKNERNVRRLPAVATNDVEYWQCLCGTIWATRNGEPVRDPWMLPQY
jgi:hypothetical protein